MKTKNTRKPAKKRLDPEIARDALLQDTFDAMRLDPSIPLNQLPSHARTLRDQAARTRDLIRFIERLAAEVPKTEENQAILEEAERLVREFNARNR